jgi:hypothetical protein
METYDLLEVFEIVRERLKGVCNSTSSETCPSLISGELGYKGNLCPVCEDEFAWLHPEFNYDEEGILGYDGTYRCPCQLADPYCIPDPISPDIILLRLDEFIEELEAEVRL